MTTFPFRNVFFESNEPTEITFQTADKEKLRWSQAKMVTLSGVIELDSTSANNNS